MGHIEETLWQFGFSFFESPLVNSLFSLCQSGGFCLKNWSDKHWIVNKIWVCDKKYV
jgi:hypothetical protein